MARFCRPIAWCFAIALALSSTMPAHAGFTSTLVGTGAGGTGVSVSYPGAGSPNPWSGFAGEIRWDALNPTVIPGLTSSNGNYSTFCIQLGSYVQNPQSFFATNLASLPDTIGNPGMGADKANLIAELWAERRGSLSTNSEHQAFQLAIWEIIYENGQLNSLTLADGALKASTSTATSLADIWLGTLDGTARDANGNVIAFANVVGLRGLNGAQDQLSVLQSGYSYDREGNIIPTPVPPAIAMAIAGIVPCFLLRRRLNRPAG